MKNLLAISDAGKSRLVVLTLDDAVVQQPAVDLVFDLLGIGDPLALVKSGVLAEGHLDDFAAFQSQIFDRDDQGLFIRDDVNFLANGSGLNPDAPLAKAFVKASKDGSEYKRCDLVVTGGANVGVQAEPSDEKGSIEVLAKLLLLHQLSLGFIIDVTREMPELSNIIAQAEKEELLEIDVKKASYALSEKGKRSHASFIAEAQDLIRRFDIFADVDLDAAGNVHFDTGLGKDLRVAVYELEGVDPYRARFLLGLNDGEWDGLENWTDLVGSQSWYREIFRPVDSALSIDDIGRAKLEHIVDRGKAVLRSDSSFAS